ncbi:MAG: putative transporter [Paludibacteraceae bacterium]|nr:putative transporter [Paludibacteraceae bacterium]MBR6597559.1 putative transporter [Paludibacteraceae bacterium]
MDFSWLTNLFTSNESVAHIALLYAIVISTGIYLGKIKVMGISLGVTFVLFTGILAGHLKITAPVSILTFIQDFGLILFVFMIGLQAGPGFFNSFKKGGVTMNKLAMLTILLNVLVMFGCYYCFFDTTDEDNLPMLVGTLFGAVTNTPGLGAASEALTTVFTDGNAPLIVNGYACAYPLGVVGIILATIAIRFITKTDLTQAEKELDSDVEETDLKPEKQCIILKNNNFDGKTLKELRHTLDKEFVCSRLLHDGVMIFPCGSTRIYLGDVLFIVSMESEADALVTILGEKCEMDWDDVGEGKLISKSVVVTNPKINGRTLRKMHLNRLYEVNVTRVNRGGIVLFASPSLELKVGDKVRVVGREDAVERVRKLFGDCVKTLHAPNIATIFIGIFVGIIFGSIPISIPSMPVPLKLGIAGGPLIIALLIGRFGHKIGLVTYTTTSANLMLREIGLVLFLASVGIKAGDSFIDTVVAGDGALYVLSGLLITVIPILIVGTIARLHNKLNYYTIMGMLAGTYTDPPALAYANSVCMKDAPSVGYSTVYPLSMFLRILTAQLIVLLACG